MNFKFFRNKINSRNVSVKELINDIFLKIDSKDLKLIHIFVLQKKMQYCKQKI